MAVLYNSVHFTLLILLLHAKVNDQISKACIILVPLTELIILSVISVDRLVGMY